METKWYKRIIIILGIIALISTALCIYFGAVNPSKKGQELADTIERQAETILTQRDTILELQDNHAAALIAVESAQGKAGLLEVNANEILIITRRQNDNLLSIAEIAGGINLINIRSSVEAIFDYAIQQTEENNRIIKMLGGFDE